MAVPPPQRATLVGALGRELAARAPEVGQIADESSQVESQFLVEAPRWLSVEDTPRWLSALAHHLYDLLPARDLVPLETVETSHTSTSPRCRHHPCVPVATWTPPCPPRASPLSY
jgi:hypothetical protein